MKLSQLQLKMEAKAAKDKIANLRESYKAPVRTEADVDSSSPFDDQWISSMKKDLDALEAVEFELGDGNKFTFGLTDEYKGQLAEKNARLDEFFDPYVQEDGSWDYDKLNMHRSVIDNIETIVQSVYKQGMADGQRGIVDRAANVSTNSPNQGVAQPTEASPLADQLRNALGLNRGFGSSASAVHYTIIMLAATTLSKATFRCVPCSRFCCLLIIACMPRCADTEASANMPTWSWQFTRLVCFLMCCLSCCLQPQLLSVCLSLNLIL